MKALHGVALVNNDSMSVTQLFIGKSSFYNMFWNFAVRKQACISLLKSVRARRPLFTKTMVEILSSSISSICFMHDPFEWRNKKNNNIRTITISFAVA